MSKKKSPIGFTTKGIIGMAGGTGEVARLCEVPIQSVAKWKYIPSWHAQKIAVKTGLPLEIIRPDMVQNGHDKAIDYTKREKK
jgi:hypothetical protein